jgi:hypothetical protein
MTPDASADMAHLGRVHEIVIDTCDAPDEIKAFFIELNRCAHRLQSAKQLKLDPPTGITSTVI